jgi:hypothetical protein
MEDKRETICRTFKDLNVEACTASWWQMLKAKLFGTEIVTEDSGWRCVSYQYKGVLYISKLSRFEG